MFIHRLLLSVAISLSVLTAAVADPQLTDSQAIQIATTFCEQIGSPATDTATAKFGGPARYVTVQDTYWQPRWRVKFGDKVEVDVVDATGTVSRYYNRGSLRALLAQDPGMGTPLSEGDAIQRASVVLAALGSNEPLSNPEANLVQLTEPATAAGALWIVSWPRQFQGVPYRKQQARVMLRADTGDVRGAGLTFPTPAPAPTSINITSATAAATAQTALTQAGIQNPVQAIPQQQVVQPNTLWQTGGGGTPQNGSSRIAWVCSYSAGNNTFEVWVDVETGSLIGGAGQGIGGTRDRIPHLNRKPPEKLHRPVKERPKHTDSPTDHPKRTTP